jgi:hypothetical protein
MNTNLSSERFDQYLQFVGRAIVVARSACQANDAGMAEAILDMIHNLPRFLAGHEYSDFEREFFSMYMEPLVERYPSLKPLADELPSAE